METLKLNKKTNEVLKLVQKIAFTVGLAAVFAAGLLYIILGEVVFGENPGIQSIWLMIAIILTFGSAGSMILSTTKKEQKVAMFVWKGVAIVLAICFIVFLVIYFNIAAYGEPLNLDEASSFVKTFAIRRVELTDEGKVDIFSYYDYYIPLRSLTIWMSVIAGIGAFAQVVDVALTAIVKDEE